MPRPERAGGVLAGRVYRRGLLDCLGNKPVDGRAEGFRDGRPAGAQEETAAPRRTRQSATPRAMCRSLSGWTNRDGAVGTRAGDRSAGPLRQTEQRHHRHRVPRSATVRRERAPVASRLLLVVQLSSERARRAVRQHCSFAEKQASPVRSWSSSRLHDVSAAARSPPTRGQHVRTQARYAIRESRPSASWQGRCSRRLVCSPVHGRRLGHRSARR